MNALPLVYNIRGRLPGDEQRNCAVDFRICARCPEPKLQRCSTEGGIKTCKKTMEIVEAENRRCSSHDDCTVIDEGGVTIGLCCGWPYKDPDYHFCLYGARDAQWFAFEPGWTAMVSGQPNLGINQEPPQNFILPLPTYRSVNIVTRE